MRSLKSYVNNAPKCEPRPSAIHGFGLFAKTNIAAGESFMALSGGTIVSASDYLANAAELMDDEWNALSKNELLVRSVRTYYYFINHQFHANARVDIFLRSIIARVDIHAQDEITLNYLEEPLPQLYLEKYEASYLLPNSPKHKASKIPLINPGNWALRSHIARYKGSCRALYNQHFREEELRA